MYTNAVPMMKRFTAAAAILLAFLLCPLAGIAGSADTNGAQEPQLYLFTLSIAEQEEFAQQYAMMSQEEFNDTLQAASVYFSKSQMQKFTQWLLDRKIHIDTVSRYTAGGEDKAQKLRAEALANFSNMDEQQRLQLSGELREMSPEAFNASLLNSLPELSPEQRQALIAWLLENCTQGQGTASFSSQMSDEEKKASADTLAALSEADYLKLVSIYKMSIPAENYNGLLQYLANDGRFATHQSMLDLATASGGGSCTFEDMLTAENTAAIAAPAGDTAADGEETPNAFLSGLPAEERQGILDMFSGMQPEDAGNLFAALHGRIPNADFQALVGWLLEHGVAVPESAAASLAPGGDGDTVTGVSQMNKAQQDALLDRISRMTPDEFNAYLGLLRGILPEEAYKEFYAWLGTVYNLDTSCNGVDIVQMPTTFRVYTSCPWPSTVPTPAQGAIMKFSQGGSAIEIQMQRMAKSTYEEWKTLILQSGEWVEDAQKGKALIEEAIGDGFGPKGHTAEEYFAENGLTMDNVLYFASVTGNSSGLVAFGANNALLIVSKK